jgi:2-dehydro-3-deoxyphosphogluconate aldolase/(4S)-4-hydroxy-2-oxoglutarate aldolase
MPSSFSEPLFRTAPIVGILRGTAEAHLQHILGATLEGGLTNIEITMNTAGAASQIKSAVQIVDGRMNVGAGTVTDLRLLEEALAAGASFIVTPTISEPVIQRCVELGVPVFPGAFSPTEISRAWDLGATMVKIFPADTLGPSYIKNLKGPFPNLKLMPTGGVSLETIADFAKAGADGYGIGSPLFKAERLAAQDWPWVAEQTRKLLQALRNR